MVSSASVPANDVLKPTMSAARPAARPAARQDDVLQTRSTQPTAQVSARTEQTTVTAKPATPSRTQPQLGTFGALVSMLRYYAKSDGTDGQKREKSALTVAKETLLMAFGKDEGDDYECANG